MMITGFYFGSNIKKLMKKIFTHLQFSAKVQVSFKKFISRFFNFPTGEEKLWKSLESIFFSEARNLE